MSRAAPVSDADVRRLTRFLDDSVGGTADLWKAHGDLAAFEKDGRLVVFAAGPAHHRVLFARTDVLQLSTGLPGPKNSAQRAFTRGVFGINGAHHQYVRRLLMPSFRKPVVDGHHGRLAGFVREALAPWRAGQTRDLYRDMKALSLLMTNRLLFGGGDEQLAREVDEAFDTWLDVNHRVSFAALLPVAWAAAEYDHLLAVAEHLGELLRRYIAECRRHATGGGDVMAHLFAARAAGELTDQDVLGLVHSLFNAAHHTTTAALSWTLFLVAQHPDVNADLLAELTSADPRARTGTLDRVIKEGMRLLPPVVYVCRYATEPLRLGETDLPAGSVVVGGLYVTMHAPEAFPRPQRFDPGRWVGHAACPHSNVPFGGGARMCLGAPLATSFMQIALGLIVPRFRLTVAPGSRIDRHATLTLRPARGIPVLVRDQDRGFSTSPVTGTIHEMVDLPAVRTGAVAA